MQKFLSPITEFYYSKIRNSSITSYSPKVESMTRTLCSNFFLMKSLLNKDVYSSGKFADLNPFWILLHI